MQHTTQRTGRLLVTLALTVSLLAAPCAWASPSITSDPGAWLSQLWIDLVAWLAPAESGASIDPDGIQSVGQANATTGTWSPSDTDPGATDASGTGEDDSGASIDPSG